MYDSSSESEKSILISVGKGLGVFAGLGAFSIGMAVSPYGDFSTLGIGFLGSSVAGITTGLTDYRGRETLGQNLGISVASAAVLAFGVILYVQKVVLLN